MKKVIGVYRNQDIGWVMVFLSKTSFHMTAQDKRLVRFYFWTMLHLTNLGGVSKSMLALNESIIDIKEH